MTRARRVSLAIAGIAFCAAALEACRSSIVVPSDEPPARVTVQSLGGASLLVTWSAVPGAEGFHILSGNEDGTPPLDEPASVYDGDGKIVDFPGGASRFATVRVVPVFPRRAGKPSPPVRTYVTSSPYAPEPLWVGSGETIGDGYGRSIASGDFNGDGQPDLAVGAPGFGAGTGRVYVYYGNAEGLGTAADTRTGNPGDEYGFALAAGPLTRPGIDDLLIGAPGANQVWRNPGLTSGLAPYGDAAAAPSGMTRFGESIAVVPDIGSDGLPDSVIGAPADAAGFGGASGWEWPNGVSNRRWQSLSSSQPGDRFGASLATLPQGRIAVGIPGRTFSASSTSAGLVAILTAADGTFHAQVSTGAGGAHFGESLIDAGDVDGDGFDDLAVGAPLSTSMSPSIRSGRVYVFYGSGDPDGFDSPASFDGFADGDRFGECLAPLGDLDIAPGAHFAAGAPGQSTVRLLAGLPPGRAITDISFFPDLGGGGFGVTVQRVGDLNRDGRPEIAIGAPGAGAGKVHVHPSLAQASPVVSAGQPQSVAAGTDVYPDAPSFSDPASPNGWYRCTWSFDGVEEPPLDCVPSDPSGSIHHAFTTKGAHWTKLHVDALQDGRFGESLTRIDVR